MSGIYIPGMERPKSCGNCFSDTHCDNWRLRNWGMPPPDDCPLVEIEDGILFGTKDGQIYKAKISSTSGKAITIIREDEALNAVANIVNAPAADVQPVRHGRYITDDNGDSSCSECGEWYLDVTKNYCPNCGARLDLEAERW